MAPNPDAPLDETAALMAAVFAEPSQVTNSLQAVFKALEKPNSKVVVELPWYKDGGKHQLVLKAREGNRVVFYNPLGHGSQKAGTEITQALKRRVEADGTESCELGELEALFRAGKARALISPP
ncbi:MAG: hypothetical protein JWM80_2489 [Cyanobacteria bacterium RYN_339]|nr:hypothetical protein [Cyanobacteria bacterium RYN_339]